MYLYLFDYFGWGTARPTARYEMSPVERVRLWVVSRMEGRTPSVLLCPSSSLGGDANTVRQPAFARGHKWLLETDLQAPARQASGPPLGGGALRPLSSDRKELGLFGRLLFGGADGVAV
jgi:hypothetical protein